MCLYVSGDNVYHTDVDPPNTAEKRWLKHSQCKCVKVIHRAQRVSCGQEVMVYLFFSTGSPAQWRLKTTTRLSGVSHKWTSTRECACLSLGRSLTSAAFSQGREPVRHSQATSDRHQWPLRTGHLICPCPPILDSQRSSPAFLRHVPGTWSSALPLLPSSISCSGWEQTKLGQHWEKKIKTLNLGSPYCCKLSYKSILDHFIYRTDAHIFKIVYFYVYFCPSVCGVICKWPHFYPHLREREM